MKLGPNRNNIIKAAPKQIGAVSGPSFKGIVPQKIANVFNNLPNKYNVSEEAINKLDGVLDGKFSKYVEQARELISKGEFKNKFQIEDGEFIFEDLSFFKKFKEKITHPFKNLWLDMANNLFEKFDESKFFKRSTMLQNIRNSDTLVQRKKYVEADKIFDTLHGIIDMAVKKKPGEAARGVMEFNTHDVEKAYYEVFNGKKGSYSTESERALNKIACGFVSGTFAAKDFYNITRYYSDDDTKAKKAQSKRLKQELFRSGINAGLIYTGMGAISKYTNNNKRVAIISLMGTTLIAELGSRLLNKTPILPLTAEQAKKLHEKKYGKSQQRPMPLPQMAELQNFTKSPDAIEKFKAGTASGNLDFTKKVNFAGVQEQQDAKEAGKEKGSSLLKNILIGFGALFATGVAVGLDKNRGGRIGKLCEKLSMNLSEVYKKITAGSEKVSKANMDKLMGKLKKAGNDTTVRSFEKILKEIGLNEDASGKYYVLKRANGRLKPLIDILLFPFEFVLKAPKMGEKFARKLTRAPQGARKATQEIPLKTERLAMMYRKLSKKTKLPDAKFSNCAESAFQRAFSINSSGLDNKKLVGDFLTFNTLIPSYFFVNDFRNLELIESNGEDKERISSTTKTKVGQRFVNFFSNKLFVNVFTSIFGGAYNSSLAGAAAVSALTEVTNETTIRKLIGVPTKKMSKSEIEEFENKNYYSPGWKGKYMRFVSNLTGKKPLGQKAEAEQKKAAKSQ